MAILFIGVSTAAEPDQSHNLSEIDPIDVDLNMSDQAIVNLSELRLNDGIGNEGLVLDGYQIKGSENILKLDSSNSYWSFIDSSGNDIARFKDRGNVEIPEGNLNLTGGKADFRSTSSDGDVVFEVNVDGQNYSMVQNTAGVNADLQWRIDGKSKVAIIDGPGAMLLNGGLNMGGNKVKWLDALRDDASSDTIVFSGNDNVKIPNGYLDLSGNNLTGVGGTECAANEYISGNGSCISDQTISDDQELEDVLSLNNSAGNENINMSGNAINQVGGIDASESYSDHSLTTPDLSNGQWQVLDKYNGQDIIRFKNGGNVEVPSGHLSLSDTELKGVDDIRSTGNANQLRLYTDGNGNNIKLMDGSTGNEILVAKGDDTHNVEVPNGNIDTKGNNITSSGGRMCIGGNC